MAEKKRKFESLVEILGKEVGLLGKPRMVGTDSETEERVEVTNRGALLHAQHARAH